jgi:hypothetical protein
MLRVREADWGFVVDIRDHILFQRIIPETNSIRYFS